MVSKTEWQEWGWVSQVVKLMSLCAFKPKNDVTRLLCYCANYFVKNELGIEES